MGSYAMQLAQHMACCGCAVRVPSLSANGRGVQLNTLTSP